MAVVTPTSFALFDAATLRAAFERVMTRSDVADSSACWPCRMAQNRPGGYPQIVVGGREGKKLGAHRLVCFISHGEPPSAAHEAAHSCGRTDCVNPTHLRWATRRENCADIRRHGNALIGERNPQSRLTQADVDCIWSRLRDGDSAYRIAKDLGVSHTTVLDVKNGRTWCAARPRYPKD